MGTIIDFNAFRNKQTSTNPSAFYDQEEHYWCCIEDMKLLLPAFMETAEDALRDAGFDPNRFVISRESMREYLAALFDPKSAGESYDGPAFDKISEDEIVRLTTRVDVEDGEMLDFSCEMYKIEGYNDGNREWLYYDFDGHTWGAGPGEDFFDVTAILNEQNS